jgi:hypothetical protein
MPLCPGVCNSSSSATGLIINPAWRGTSFSGWQKFWTVACGQSFKQKEKKNNRESNWF